MEGIDDRRDDEADYAPGISLTGARFRRKRWNARKSGSGWLRRWARSTGNIAKSSCARYGALKHSGNCGGAGYFCRFSEDATAAGEAHAARSPRSRMGTRLVQPPAIREGKQAMVVNCEQVWREVSNYLEGEVDPALRSAMDEHFRTCVRCKSVLEGHTAMWWLCMATARHVGYPHGLSRGWKKESRRAGASAADGQPGRRGLCGRRTSADVGTLGIVGLKRSTIHSNHNMHNPVTTFLQTCGSSGDDAKYSMWRCEFIHDKARVRTLTAKQAIEEGDTPCLRCLRKYLDVAKSGTPAGRF